MSSQPHIDHVVLPWNVRRTRLPLLTLRCVGCGAASATTGEGRFRVNANGKLLDVWLLVRCVACDRTGKLTVHERAPARSVADLQAYENNDSELVARWLLDPLFARRNRFTLDWTDAWHLVTPPEPPDSWWPVKVEVSFADPVPVRPDRLIAQGLGISRAEIERRIKSEISLVRRINTDFSFIVQPAD
ncbi:DUF1062 domain-containing protein [Nonomuraea endophytica]|uniref:DUF1062 domain-containing protein n=1 Tax=Nonomuraea endophytica TaxID=714136 RepID=UPI0037C50BC1